MRTVLSRPRRKSRYRRRGLAAAAPDARIRYFLVLAERIHPGVSEHFEGGTSWVWHDDPWQKGAYAVLRRDEMERFLPHVATPEGRIHIAGDAASDYPGWMQGGLTAGLRAAQAINDAG